MTSFASDPRQYTIDQVLGALEKMESWDEELDQVNIEESPREGEACRLVTRHSQVEGWDLATRLDQMGFSIDYTDRTVYVNILKKPLVFPYEGSTA